MRVDEVLSEKIGPPTHHVYDGVSNSVWVYADKAWHCIDPGGEVRAYEYLGLFPELRSIASSANRRFVAHQSGK